MPPTSLVDPDKAKAAFRILIRAPGVTVREAMILAKFTEEEASTKSMQNKCVRLMNIKKKAKRVLEKKGDDEKCMIGSDLDAVLAYYNCPKRNTLGNVEEKKRA
jgi:hypothetical protein